MAPSDQRSSGRARLMRRPQRSSFRGLSVAVVDERGRPADAAGLSRWLARIAPRAARGTVTLALVPDAKVRELNGQYRRKPYATDVLSFPFTASGSSRAGGSVQTVEPHVPGKRRRSPPIDRWLGDIVVARGVARRQARDAGHSTETELKILALHGLLHLIGYDHERDGGRMARVERRLRRKGGLGEALIERATSKTGRRGR